MNNMMKTGINDRAKTAIRLVGVSLFALMVFTIPEKAEAIPRDTAVLQGLDKVTARVSRIVAPVNQTVKFGALEITVRHCDKSPPEEPPEAAAFIEVDEVKKGEEPTRDFTGWMFASSPALNALEHPVYDLWVLDCVDGIDAAEQTAPVQGGNGNKAQIDDSSDETNIGD